MLTRRSALLGMAALAACGGRTEVEPGRKLLAVTMDDFRMADDPVLARERDARIRSHLPRQAAAFVNGRHEDSSEFFPVLKDWAEDGHIIANHSYSHMWSSRHPQDEITADIARNHRLLADRPGFEPYFRFPFLDEGNTPEQKLGLYTWLREAGYTPAPVTLDTFDWNVNGRLDGDNNAKVRDFWLDLVSAEAEYAHQLAGRLGYRDLPHQMLVHHLALDALYLGDLLDRLGEEGWEVIDARTALDFPPYAEPPPPIPGWGNWLGIRKRALGVELPRPAILTDFGTPAMDALGL